MNKVSVVIPAFNEEKYIQNTLFSLLKSEQNTRLDYEVILIDNSSTDKTVEIARQFAKGLNLKIIHEEKKGRGAARAKGFSEAGGEIILSADADTIFYNGWIDTMAGRIKGDVIAVTSSCKIADCSPLTNFIFNLIQPALMVLYKLIIGHYWLSGFSFGILKSAYDKTEGFDRSLNTLEDLDLSFKVAKIGKIEFINKPVTFSGRRFKGNLFAGLYGYIDAFVTGLIFKKKNIHMNDPR